MLVKTKASSYIYSHPKAKMKIPIYSHHTPNTISKGAQETSLGYNTFIMRWFYSNTLGLPQSLLWFLIVTQKYLEGWRGIRTGSTSKGGLTANIYKLFSFFYSSYITERVCYYL